MFKSFLPLGCDRIPIEPQCIEYFYLFGTKQVLSDAPIGHPRPELEAICRFISWRNATILVFPYVGSEMFNSFLPLFCDRIPIKPECIEYFYLFGTKHVLPEAPFAHP